MNQWATVGTALLGFLTVARKFFLEGKNAGLASRIERHKKLLQGLSDATAAPLRDVLDADVQKYADRMRRIQSRTIDGGTVGALILCVLAAAGVVAAGTWAAEFLGWWIWIPTALVAGFFLLLLVAGSFQFYKYPDESKP